MAYIGRFGQSDDYRREEFTDNRTFRRELDFTRARSSVL